MPLSLFDHYRFIHFQSLDGLAGDFDHSFGGSSELFGLQFVNSEHPFHLLYRLDLRDPSIPVRLKAVNYLPLVYGFRYAGNDGTFINRVVSDHEIEILSPLQLQYDSDFPYPGHPSSFPVKPVSFRLVPYDRTKAEDALSLQGVFGLDGLSNREMKRAIDLGLANESYVSFSREDLPDPDWTDEEILRFLGRAPFMQSAPSKSCDNPNCTAEVAYHVDASEIELPLETAELIGESTLTMEAYDVRVDTMTVIALHQPDRDDDSIWGDPYVQMVFEICNCCHCIRVSNQCT